MGLLHGARGALNKGNADGAVGIFGYTRRVRAPVLRSDPPKKALCHTCPLGGASIKYRRKWGLAYDIKLQLMVRLYFWRFQCEE